MKHLFKYNENIQQARSILRKTGNDETHKDFNRLRDLLSGNRGYVGHFTRWLLVDKIPFKRLESLYNEHLKNKRLPTPINNYKTPEDVIESLLNVEIETALNQMVKAIPSRTRTNLKNYKCPYCNDKKEWECTNCDDGKYECDECDGGEQQTCYECDGEGHFDCYECEEGKVECWECEGENSDECDECDDGEMDCEECYGEGRTDCYECDGEGTHDCYECGGAKECWICKGTGTAKCTHCLGSKNPWADFQDFLRTQYKKKDDVIRFFAHKGGRYDGTNFQQIKNDIEAFLRLPTLEKIIEDSKTDEDVRTLFENEKYYMIAVNYKSMQKYGSSMWCIFDDEYTFDEYVYEEGTCIQMILYDKSKIPFFEDESVIGITYDFMENYIPAAHWEDDESAVYEIRDIFKSIKFKLKPETKFIEIYDMDRWETEYIFPFLLENGYIKTINFENLMQYISCGNFGNIDVIKGMIDKDKSKFQIVGYADNYNILTLINQGFIKYFTHIKESGFALPLRNIQDKEGLKHLLKISDNNTLTQCLENSIRNGYMEMSDFILGNIDIKISYTCLVSNFNDREWDAFYKRHNSKLIYDYCLSVFDKKMVSKTIIPTLFRYISDAGKLDQYKDKMITIIESGDLEYKKRKYITDYIDDDDIDIAVARQSLSKRVRDKFKVKFKRLAPKNIKKYGEFKKGEKIKDNNNEQH